jgi:hypothetical protein
MFSANKLDNYMELVLDLIICSSRQNLTYFRPVTATGLDVLEESYFLTDGPSTPRI